MWASWNGATEVRAWEVLAGLRASHLIPLRGPVPVTGFETAIPLPGAFRYVAVQALGAGSRVLARSRAVATKG